MGDARKNLAYSLVVTAPSPATTGTSLVVTTGHGTRFPAVPFNATVCAADEVPTPANAEIVRVTNISSDTLTITREQESTTARAIVAGDQIFAAITDKTFLDLESAVSVVSQALSVETAARVAADNTLSNNLSVLSQATSAAMAALSLGVVAADLHASTASAAATSADAHAAAASAAATSVDARLNTLSGLHHVLSDKVVSMSAQLVSLETHASAASAAATSADAHAAAASAAATSVDTRVNALSNIVSVLSNVVSDALSAGSAASVANAAAHTSLEAHASAASAAATSVNARVTSVNTALSALSARSVGNVSTHGLQSILDALSNRISAGGGASVTSNELSAEGALRSVLSDKVVSMSAQFASVNGFLASLSAHSAGGVSTHGLQSILNALSNRISAAGGGGGSVTSTELSTRAPWPVAKYLIVSDTQSTNLSTLVDISGLVLTVAADETWQVEGRLWMSVSGNTNGIKLGVSAPPLSTPRNAVWGLNFVSGATLGTYGGGPRWEIGGAMPVSGNSVMISIVSVVPAGLPFGVAFDAIFNVTSGGTFRLMMAGISNPATHALPGSYLMCHRLK